MKRVLKEQLAYVAEQKESREEKVKEYLREKIEKEEVLEKIFQNIEIMSEHQKELEMVNSIKLFLIASRLLRSSERVEEP